MPQFDKEELMFLLNNLVVAERHYRMQLRMLAETQEQRGKQVIKQSIDKEITQLTQMQAKIARLME